MKVGTDAVLLGAIAEPASIPTRILDIGTGCGILALMMAQRFVDTTIDAIDIDAPSISIAKENVLHSPWSNRVFCYHSSIQDFAEQKHENYSLIISNPPYFSNSLRNNDIQKRLARHDDAMPPTMLFVCSYRMLNPDGELWIVIPSSEKEKFISAAETAYMNSSRIIDICTAIGKTPKLTILSFSKKTASSPVVTTHYMRDDTNRYSSWYRQVTGAFLL